MSNLKKHREAAGLSQSKLATAAGVNVCLIQHYEQGVRNINAAAVGTVYKLAQVLGCRVEDLMEK